MILVSRLQYDTGKKNVWTDISLLWKCHSIFSECKRTFKSWRLINLWRIINYDSRWGRLDNQGNLSVLSPTKVMTWGKILSKAKVIEILLFWKQLRNFSITFCYSWMARQKLYFAVIKEVMVGVIPGAVQKSIMHERNNLFSCFSPYFKAVTLSVCFPFQNCVSCTAKCVLRWELQSFYWSHDRCILESVPSIPRIFEGGIE